MLYCKSLLSDENSQIKKLPEKLQLTQQVSNCDGRAVDGEERFLKWKPCLGRASRIWPAAR